MKIEIKYVWDEVEKYIEAVEQGGSADELWEEIVIAPYWEKLCCYSPKDLGDRKPKPIKNINILKEQLLLLKAMNVSKISYEFERIAGALPNYDDDPITVVIFPLEDDSSTVKEKQNGVIGTSLWGNLLIQVNPFAEEFEKWIPYVFAHEYHHTVWGNYWFMLHGGELQNMFIDSLVIDGEADSFALSLYPSLKPKWIFELTEEVKEQMWRENYADIVREKNVDYVKYMFGDETADIPGCCGYAIGYMLVQKYIRKKGVSIKSILEINPYDILKEISA